MFRKWIPPLLGVCVLALFSGCATPPPLKAWPSNGIWRGVSAKDVFIASIRALQQTGHRPKSSSTSMADGIIVTQEKQFRAGLIYKTYYKFIMLVAQRSPDAVEIVIRVQAGWRPRPVGRERPRDLGEMKTDLERCVMIATENFFAEMTRQLGPPAQTGVSMLTWGL